MGQRFRENKVLTAPAKGRRKGKGWPRVVQAQEENSRRKEDGRT